MIKRSLIALVGACALGACGGEQSTTVENDTPWTTTVDSTGDTIQVRIAGEIPPRLVRSLVPELRVGAADGEGEAVFGSLDIVLGTPAGGLLVYDGQEQAALMFDSTGAFVRRVGAKGGGPGEHGHLNGIAALPSGDWIFWDAQGGRLNRYSPAGEYVGMVRATMTGWFLQDGLRTDTAGYLYAWTMLERGGTASRIDKAGFIKVDTAGVVLDTLVFPNWGTEPGFLSAESADGGSSTTYGLPWGGGAETTILPSGTLVSGPGREYVLYILPAAAKPVRIEREYAPVSISATESQERRAQITRVMRRVNPAWTWTGPDIPATKPAYQGFRIGADGRIWVRVYTAGESIPVAELAPVEPGPNPPIRMTTREPELYDVFTPDGRLLGRVAPPPRTQILGARGNLVWGVQTDSLDVPQAVRFRVEPGFPM